MRLAVWYCHTNPMCCRARQVKSARVDDVSDHDFNETYQFRVIDLDTQSLSVTVWDYDRVGSDEVIGKVDLPLSRFGGEDLTGEMVTIDEYIQAPQKKGEIPGMPPVACAFSQCTRLEPYAAFHQMTCSDLHTCRCSNNCLRCSGSYQGCGTQETR